MKVHEIRKVFDNGLHNAFTSIAWFQGRPYIAFRCGHDHVSADGRVLVLRGDDDACHWLPVAVIWAGIDTRDPKLLATAEGLFVYAFSRRTDPDRIVSGYAFSSDGDAWQPWQAVEADWVYWRPELLWDTCYVAAYGRAPGGGEGPVVLKRSEDGRAWQDVCVLVEQDGTWPNETALALAPDRTMWALIRRERGSGRPILCRARAPYTIWEQAELPIKLQGPYLWLVDETVYISGRWYQPSGQVNTAVFRMRGLEPEPQLVLPSGGDTSYMGAVPVPGENRRWWLTYYSSHEYLRHGEVQPAAIYLADVSLG